MNRDSAMPANLLRRKKDTKRGITYTMLLCGRDGVGKTTFANNLLESNIFSHKYNVVNQITAENESKVKVISPTKVVSYNSKNGIPTFMSELDPSRAQFEPGITITSTSVEIGDLADETANEDDIILFNLVNTYGIGENLDDSLCFDELTTYLEQQFDLVLAEETRIKRNPRFEDTRVHIILYFIEPTGHGLRELDVELMKRLSRYSNVLPIISKADSFGKEELAQFKKTIMKDVELYNVPIYKFEVDPEDDDLETIEENQTLASLQPFSIICSDVKDKNGSYVRSYPWGDINITTDNISDLKVLKNVLFGSHLQEFKDTTQNLLYENYRAEKLSTVTSPHIGASGKDNTANRASAAPSLSNFASLVNTGQFKSSQTLAMNLEGARTPELKEPYDNDQASPIKKMSQALKEENEEIIKNIKMESPLINDHNIPEKTKLRNISETVPYVLRHERIIARQQKLEELEAQSAKELQKRIQDLEKKAHNLKLREKLLRQQKDHSSSSSSLTTASSGTQLKKEDTLTDLASIASGRN
ncbi:hypothetical protein Kpol_1054p29 [Vanderwaltozyma polyspora DSM 70294]|uniref:Septin-type G domain-containing protein n=1 Tax=Vanderwaltozyma polyspora (strain ATCC 22028 / DSM 70294 / BCRC 21397 / CBS 2163 / NBRC 10782 / NRRL Y-8283 / UCD 57-17) TaxID=436907 RepID=A7TIB6_VANPO|nr:uncharacterized protein Kpol_1054p29 [Vanderwaltozyma polyspora DSM 70294]EDO17982.1 hypothetical protein Kpol_1054p29 [Vanderwaltozyma polyspora DSM 70294]